MSFDRLPFSRLSLSRLSFDQLLIGRLSIGRLSDCFLANCLHVCKRKRARNSEREREPNVNQVLTIGRAWLVRLGLDRPWYYNHISQSTFGQLAFGQTKVGLLTVGQLTFGEMTWTLTSGSKK